MAYLLRVIRKIASDCTRPDTRTILNELADRFPNLYHKNASWLDVKRSTLPKLPRGKGVRVSDEVRRSYDASKREFEWERRLRLFGRPSCTVCNSTDGVMFHRKRVLQSITDDWPPFCCASCSMGSPEVVAKRRATCIRDYGVDNVSRSPTVLARITRKKRKWYTDPKLRKKLRDKTRRTCMARYGVEYAMQHPDVFYRSNTRRYRRKTVRIRGVVYDNLQGFEPFAVRWLIEKHDARILNKGRTSFRYSLDGRERTYFPDVIACVNGRRIVVEVKSTYTAGITDGDGWRERFDNLRAKAKSVGPSFLLIIVGKSGRVLAAKRGIPLREKLQKIVRRSLARVS